MTAPLQMRLFHGRNDPNAMLDGWGFDGDQIRGIAFLHGTHHTTMTVGFINEDACETARRLTGWRAWDELILEVSRHDYLTKVHDGYYGDFELLLEPS